MSCDLLFEAQRPRLTRLAYRMLGSLAEADDAVQETWVRFERTDTADVENLRAWLTTVVSRVSLNFLRTRRSRVRRPFYHGGRLREGRRLRRKPRLQRRSKTSGEGREPGGR